MIKQKENYFLLETKNTSYAFYVMESGHLQHLHYGGKLNIDMTRDVKEAFAPIVEKQEFLPGNGVAYSKDFPNLCLEDLCLEVSSIGKGDIREPFIELIYPDGSRTCDFRFHSFNIEQEKEMLQFLPSAYGDEVEQLIITLKDRYGIVLKLFYSLFYDCDVIVRSAKVINEGEQSVKIERCMSTQVDFDGKNLVFTSFTGAWAREMNRSDHLCNSGLFVNQTLAGVSSNRANPFVMVSASKTNEDFGDCFGFNLIYSGNHYEALEVSPYGKSRFVSGINPRGFSWELGECETFECPEAVMSFSANGWGNLSRNLHSFVQEHIVRGEWKKKQRPILLNSWEAAYFNFDEGKLLKFAKSAAEAGVELFVMDDGWFGERDDDTSSLGDWEVNLKKLPKGLSGICEKINAMGLSFGIWVEPEMVNENSQCYRSHPDWAVKINDEPHSVGRNQMIIDLTKSQVREFIITSMRKVFSSTNISYVKWDMNRIFSDCFSDKLTDQGEFLHRYIMGLYEVLDTLTKEFPHILLEGCASGGNRSDLGILCYFQQLWASDNTDALCRQTIQQGYSYGYPLSVLGAHVSSCPNHQTLRNTPLATRFNTACFGLLGYECNLSELSKEEFSQVKDQIALYKKWRNVFQFGDFFRLKSGEVTEENPAGALHWLCVSKDKRRAVCMTAQLKVIPNQAYEKVQMKGLDPDKLYRFYNFPEKINIKNFGGLINTLAPIHIKKDSVIHNIVSKYVKLDGEVENYIVSGGTLNNCGVKLKPPFAGTGFNDQTRFYPDFASRLYFIEEVE